MTDKSNGETSADMAKMRLQETMGQDVDMEMDLPIHISKNLKDRANELACLFRSHWLESDIPILASEFLQEFKFVFLAGVTHGKSLEQAFNADEPTGKAERPAKEAQLEIILNRIDVLEAFYQKMRKHIDD